MSATLAVSGDGDRLYGLVRLGAMYVALSIHHIREVVPRPAQFVPFPGTMPEIVGAIELRGSILPVLDLAAVLGRGGDHGAIIMLLRVDDRVFGVCIDEICGVVALAPGQQTPVAVAGLPDHLVRSGFAQADRFGVVLDVERVAALPGLALAQEKPASAAAGAQAGLPTLMFSQSGFHFGLAARSIEACVPISTVSPSPVDDPLWIGMVSYNGRRVPVVDTLRMLGLGACEPARDYGCVVVRMPQGRLLGLRIDSVENILRIRPEAHLPVKAFPIAKPHLLAGLHESDRLSLLIDGDSLHKEEALCDIAGLEETSGQASEDSTQASSVAQRRPFLIVAIAGGNFAIPLEQVDEILPVNAKDRVDLPAQTNGIVGMIAHRASAVPLYDLAQHLGLGAGAAQAAYILLASAAGHRVGFLLQGLAAVERTRVQDMAQASTGSAARVPMQTIKASDGSTCSVLDLAGVIGGLALAA